MKKILYILMSISVGFAACDTDAHKNETGLAVELNMLDDDAVRDIRLWVFDANGAETGAYHFSSFAEQSRTLLPLDGGNYTIVAATNVLPPIVADIASGSGSDRDRLLITLADASASPAHIHYGVQQVVVLAGQINRVPFTLSRVFAELSLLIRNAPAEVVRAVAEVKNTAKGFYPAVGRLSAEEAIVSLGEQIPDHGTIVFPMKRLMPVVQDKTRLQLTLYYANGGRLDFELETPPLLNGGIYTPQIEYATLRPGVIIQIGPINGWTELPPANGEILNPNN